MKYLQFSLLFICLNCSTFIQAQDIDFNSELRKIWLEIEQEDQYMPHFKELVKHKGAWQNKGVINTSFELMVRGEEEAFLLHQQNYSQIINSLGKNDYDRLGHLIDWSYEIIEAELIRQKIDPEDFPPTVVEKIVLSVYQKLIPDKKTANFVGTAFLMNISEEAFWLDGMQYFIHQLYQTNWEVQIPKEGLEDLYFLVIQNSWTLYEEIEDKSQAMTYLQEGLKMAHRLEQLNTDKDTYNIIAEIYTELGNEDRANYYYKLSN